METKHLLVRGRVQGVGFRYSVYYAAKNRGVTGWVRNRADGSVEIVVQGAPAAVEEMIAWVREGPDLSRVDHVEVSEASGAFPDFAIRETV